MDFAKIIIKSSKKEVEKIKVLLSKLKEHQPCMVLSSLRYGELSGEVLVNFNVNTEYQEFVLSKLMLNDINVWAHDTKTKELMTKLNANMVQGIGSQNKQRSWADLRNKVNEKSPEEAAQKIEKLVQAGRYEDLMKISKDFRSRSTSEIAKNRLPDCVGIAIDRLAALALTKKYEADRCIQELLAIGSYHMINSLVKSEISEKAGMAALTVCNNYKDFTWDMMKIIMDKKQNKIVNLRAAAKFSERIFSDPKTFNIEIKNAVKNINVRWLQINYDVVEHLLSNEEITHINNLMNYLRNQRS